MAGKDGTTDLGKGETGRGGKDLPDVRAGDKVLAVLLSDIHLDHTPPVWRSAEPDWYAAMERPLRQVYNLCGEHKCPAVVAGDIFHKWNQPPEMINWAIRRMRLSDFGVYAIPGQHDLPHHRYQDIHKSAYWTLVMAGTVEDLGAGEYRAHSEELVLHSFPWGTPVTPMEGVFGRFYNRATHLAVIHEYCWTEGQSFPGCREDQHWKQHEKNLKGFDAAVFGDNHRGFLRGKILNSGGLMRRHADEINYSPHVGLLYPGGKIRAVTLDTSEDKFLATDDKSPAHKEASVVLAAFLTTLSQLKDQLTDFAEACNRWMDKNKTDMEVRKIVLTSLEEKLSS